MLNVRHAPALHPIALIPTAGHIPPFRLHGYSGLIRGMRNSLGESLRVDTATTLPGYEPDLRADVVLFPYDFRHGVRAAGHRLAEEIETRLKEVSVRQRLRRVIVIGHSMGGLVARHWASLPGQAELCRAVITVGTPHLGAPKALDWVVNGAAVGPGPIAAATREVLTGVTGVLRGWQAVYDLLPTYQAIKVESGDRAGDTVEPAELPQYLDAGFVASQDYASGVNAAGKLHKQIERAWTSMDPTVRPPVVPFLARDHGTPNAVYLRGDRLVVTDDDPTWQPNAGWRGDGTVPAISAVPREMQDEREMERQVPQRHTPMASAGAVTQAVRALLHGGPVRVERDGTPRWWLGVDLAEASMLGEPVRLRARLSRGVAGGAATEAVPKAAVTATIEPVDHSLAPQRIPMTRDGDGWTGTVVPARPGGWRMAVEVNELTDQPAPRVEDLVTVFDPDVDRGER